MCMNCESSKAKRDIDTRRLSLVLVLGVAIAFGLISALFLSPPLAAVLPLLVLAAGCPAMCFAPKMNAWVRGEGRPSVPARREAGNRGSGS